MCGQENEPLRLSLSEILRDALEDFIKWDSKLIHTLDPLVRRPGQLTLEWSWGRRNRYISPGKLYLTTAFIFFLVAAYVAGPAARAPVVPIKPDVSDAQLAHEAGLWRFPEVEAFVDKQFAKLRGHGTKTEIMVNRMPQAMFVLLPLFAFALGALYRRSGRFYVEHLVFALHTHSFTYLALTLAAPMRGGVWPFLALLGSGGYGFLALRRVYQQNWFKTLYKGALLGVGYLVLLIVAAFVTLLMAAMAIPDSSAI